MTWRKFDFSSTAVLWGFCSRQLTSCGSCVAFCEKMLIYQFMRWNFFVLKHRCIQLGNTVCYVQNMRSWSAFMWVKSSFVFLFFSLGSVHQKNCEETLLFGHFGKAGKCRCAVINFHQRLLQCPLIRKVPPWVYWANHRNASENEFFSKELLNNLSKSPMLGSSLRGRIKGFWLLTSMLVTWWLFIDKRVYVAVRCYKSVHRMENLFAIM